MPNCGKSKRSTCPPVPSEGIVILSKAKELVFVEAASQMSGVEFSTLYLVKHLNRTRWSPLVVCPEEGDLPTRCRAVGVPVVIIPRPRFFSTSVRVAGRPVVNPLALVANFFAIASSAQPLIRFFRTRQPALVVTKGLLAHFYGGLAARIAGIPCVWHVQDRVSERVGPLFPWALALSARMLSRQVIADAESIKRQLQPLTPPERITVIWNGVDTREFSPVRDGSHVRAEWGIQSDELLIGVIGRLTPWKGQHVLIHALARIADEFPRARAVLIGTPLFDTDTYARTLQSQVADLGLAERIIFAGYRWDLPQVLAALDVVVHTALEKDSSPLAVVSAMAAGKPIVCTRIDGTAQLFEEGVDGLLVSPGDVDALAAQLAILLRDTELRARLGRAARIKAERELSVEQFTRKCEAVLERVIQNS